MLYISYVCGVPCASFLPFKGETPACLPSGADPNSKSPFLLAFAAVGVFVVLGALAVKS